MIKGNTLNGLHANGTMYCERNFFYLDTLILLLDNHSPLWKRYDNILHQDFIIR